MLSFKQIQAARSAIEPHVGPSPLVRSSALARMAGLGQGSEVWLKCENLQKTGSFKVRGAFNALISLHNPSRVVAASMGNHAQGVAHAASALGISSRIYMPEGASLAKEAAVRSYGGEIVLTGRSLAEAMEAAQSDRSGTFVHPFDNEAVMAGQGTVGIEIMEQMPSGPPDAVVVPVGGGGLIGGVSTAVKALSSRTRVIGVQAEAAPSACLSFEQGSVVDAPPGPTMADGIAVGRVGERCLASIRAHVDEMHTVAEGQIAEAVLELMQRKHLMAEGAGAVALAWLLRWGNTLQGRRVVLVISGGNIDTPLVGRIVHRGLVESGRVGVIKAMLADSPGALGHAALLIAEHRGNILTVDHDRNAPDVPLGQTRVRFTVEVSGHDHLEQIRMNLARSGVGTQADTA
jgi:threonine dehydratase